MHPNDMTNGVQRHRDAYGTTYVIRGSEEYVDATIADIMRDYAPAGYGTRVTQRGLGHARVTRSNSCD